VRVLVTNDDGVEAPGLVALAEALVEAGHEVLVVAPSGERSGSSAAIGRLHRSGPIACTQLRFPSLPDVEVYSLDLPPAGAVYAGLLGTFGPRPDAVAAGVNPGLNTGHLVLHSGTVGAALTAVALGVPAVALSIAWSEEPHWSTAAALAAPALDWAVGAPGPARALSINVPDVDRGSLREVRGAFPAPYLEEWSTTHTPGEVRLEYQGRRSEPPPGSDLAAVLEGHVAVTTLAASAPGPPDEHACAAAAVANVLGLAQPRS
jgi:5'-nucleotidase